MIDLRRYVPQAAITLLLAIAAAPVNAGDIIEFEWNPLTNDNWGQSSNWIQTPGAGDIPDAPNHKVRFFGHAGLGKDVDLQGNSREVHSIEVFDNDQYHFRDGTLGNWGEIYVETQLVKFGPTLTYQQLGFGAWSVEVEGGVLMDAVMEGSGTIAVRGGTGVTAVNVRLNAANPYDGVFRAQIATTTLGHALALQNAKVGLFVDDPLDFNGFNPTFGGLFAHGALTLGSTVLTLDGHVRELSTYTGALTSDGNGQIICTTADRFPQEFTGSISNLGVFRVDSGLASLASGTFDFVSPFPSGAIDINGGELSIEDGAEVTLTSANANGGTVNISGGKLSIGDAELYAARITSVSNGEVALSNTDLSAPGLIIGTNGSQNISSTFAGKFTGSGSFKKVGTGALTLTGANTLTGEAIIDQGTIALGTANTLQNTILRSNVAGGLNINGFDPHIGGLRGSTALNMGDDFYTLGSDGEDASYSGVLSANSININNPTLLKTGSNVQELTGNSSFRGSVWVDGGTLRIAGGGSFAPIGNHEVETAGRLDVVEDSTLTPKPWLFVGGLVYVEDSTLDAENISLEGSTVAGLEALSGSTVTASEIYVGRESGNIGFVGVIGQGTSLSAERLRLGHDGGNGIGIVGIDDSAAVTISDFVRLTSSFSRLSVDDATLSTSKLVGVGSLGGTVALSDPAGESALTVGTQNGTSTFDGLVKDSFGGPGSITKTGTGSFTLTNANTYTGGTFVNGGTLVLGNSTGSATGTGGVSVQNGGTLAGNGSAGGTSTIASGGTVAPGTSIGAMTLQNVTFQAGSTLKVEFDGLQHDELFVTGTAALAGMLEIVDLNGLPAVGNSSVVVTAGTISGEFDALVAPAPPTGTTWSVEYDYDAGTVTIRRCDDADGDGVCNDVDACPGFDDNMDIDSDGVPDACDMDCSGFPVHVSTAQELIDAIHCANAQPDANTIYLDADITLTAADNTDADQGANGLPSVISPIVIEGQDHIIERDTNAPFFRLFRVSDEPTPGSLTMYDATLRDGLLDGSVLSVYRGGAAVLVRSAQLSMNNCILMDNDGLRNGGAILLRDAGATATLDGVIMTGNRATGGGDGGGIYVGQGQLTVRNSIIASNQSAFNGSAVMIGSSLGQAAITNTIVSGNHGLTGTTNSGITNRGTLTLVNCTLAGNKGAQAGGLYTGAGAHSTVINSLIWGNAVSTEAQIYCDGTLDVSYTGIQGGVAGITGAGTINDNGGNLNFSSSDPVFVNPVDPASAPTTAGDYHLAPNSVAIDQGNNTQATNAGLTSDFEGDARIINGQVDMGADEYALCPGDADDDGDGVCNASDVCSGFDDNADADTDGIPDGCDACAGGAASGDTHADGVVDLSDFAAASACLAGPGGSLGAGCECFDFDSDGDSDLADFAALQMGFSNP